MVRALLFQSKSLLAAMMMLAGCASVTPATPFNKQGAVWPEPPEIAPKPGFRAGL